MDKEINEVFENCKGNNWEKIESNIFSLYNTGYNYLKTKEYQKGICILEKILNLDIIKNDNFKNKDLINIIYLNLSDAFKEINNYKMYFKLKLKCITNIDNNYDKCFQFAKELLEFNLIEIAEFIYYNIFNKVVNTDKDYIKIICLESLLFIYYIKNEILNCKNIFFKLTNYNVDKFKLSIIENYIFNNYKINNIQYYIKDYELIEKLKSQFISKIHKYSNINLNFNILDNKIKIENNLKFKDDNMNISNFNRFLLNILSNNIVNEISIFDYLKNFNIINKFDVIITENINLYQYINNKNIKENIFENLNLSDNFDLIDKEFILKTIEDDFFKSLNLNYNQQIDGAKNENKSIIVINSNYSEFFYMFDSLKNENLLLGNCINIYWKNIWNFGFKCYMYDDKNYYFLGPSVLLDTNNKNNIKDDLINIYLKSCDLYSLDLDLFENFIIIDLLFDKYITLKSYNSITQKELRLIKKLKSKLINFSSYLTENFIFNFQNFNLLIKTFIEDNEDIIKWIYNNIEYSEFEYEDFLKNYFLMKYYMFSLKIEKIKNENLDFNIICKIQNNLEMIYTNLNINNYSNFIIEKDINNIMISKQKLQYWTDVDKYDILNKNLKIYYDFTDRKFFEDLIKSFYFYDKINYIYYDNYFNKNFFKSFFNNLFIKFDILDFNLIFEYFSLFNSYLQLVLCYIDYFKKESKEINQILHIVNIDIICKIFYDFLKKNLNLNLDYIYFKNENVNNNQNNLISKFWKIDENILYKLYKLIYKLSLIFLITKNIKIQKNVLNLFKILSYLLLNNSEFFKINKMFHFILHFINNHNKYEYHEIIYTQFFQGLIYKNICSFNTLNDNIKLEIDLNLKCFNNINLNLIDTKLIEYTIENKKEKKVSLTKIFYFILLINKINSNSLKLFDDNYFIKFNLGINILWTKKNINYINEFLHKNSDILIKKFEIRYSKFLLIYNILKRNKKVKNIDPKNKKNIEYDELLDEFSFKQDGLEIFEFFLLDHLEHIKNTFYNKIFEKEESLINDKCEDMLKSFEDFEKIYLYIFIIFYYNKNLIVNIDNRLLFYGKLIFDYNFFCSFIYNNNLIFNIFKDKEKDKNSELLKIFIFNSYNKQIKPNLILKNSYPEINIFDKFYEISNDRIKLFLIKDINLLINILNINEKEKQNIGNFINIKEDEVYKNLKKNIKLILENLVIGIKFRIDLIYILYLNEIFNIIKDKDILKLLKEFLNINNKIKEKFVNYENNIDYFDNYNGIDISSCYEYDIINIMIFIKTFSLLLKYNLLNCIKNVILVYVEYDKNLKIEDNFDFENISKLKNIVFEIIKNLLYFANKYIDDMKNKKEKNYLYYLCLKIIKDIYSNIYPFQKEVIFESTNNLFITHLNNIYFNNIENDLYLRTFLENTMIKIYMISDFITSNLFNDYEFLKRYLWKYKIPILIINFFKITIKRIEQLIKNLNEESIKNEDYVNKLKLLLNLNREKAFLINLSKSFKIFIFIGEVLLNKINNSIILFGTFLNDHNIPTYFNNEKEKIEFMNKLYQINISFEKEEEIKNKENLKIIKNLKSNFFNLFKKAK